MRKPILFALFLLTLISSTALAQNHVYVSSRGTSTVRMYNATTGAFVKEVIRTPPGRTSTQEVLFGPDGNLYVNWINGTSSNVVYRYTPDGDLIGAFTSGYALENPSKMQFGPDGHLYVSQWGGTQDVVKFDGATGVFIGEVAVEQFRTNPMGQAWDDQGRLLVAHFGAKDVTRYNADGTPAEVVVPGFRLSGPVNIFFGAENDLFVLDWNRGQVHRFDGSTYDFKEVFITGLGAVEGYAIGPDGHLYICDWENHVVNRYDAETGAFIETFIEDGGLMNPNSIAFHPSALVATDAQNESVLPAGIRLGQNYPNPFSASTAITFSLDRTQHVAISVYDLFGKEIARLTEGVRPPGSHSVTFDAAGLPSGTYLYRLTAGASSENRIMTLVK